MMARCHFNHPLEQPLFHRPEPLARIAVLITACSQKPIAEMVQQFRTELPTADIRVIDGSADKLPLMFRQIDADIYVLAAGDQRTCPAGEVLKLIEPVLLGDADVAVASSTDDESAYRAFNRSVVPNLPPFGRFCDIEAELTVNASKRSYRIAEVRLTSAPEVVK